VQLIGGQVERIVVRKVARPGSGFTVTPDMMSLVGCSGEEFAAILRTLGFQAERRKIVTATPAAETPVADEIRSTGEAETLTDAPEPPVEATEPPAQSEHEGQKPDAQAPPPDAEAFLDVWRPKKPKRQRPAPPRKSAAPDKRRDDRQGDGNAPRNKPPRKKERPRTDRPRATKPPATAPEDSPFAALRALKASMEEKQRSDPK